MASEPCVSVLLPARNAASTVERAARSVLGEPLELELIAVDDGSTDDTAAVLERLAREDSRVCVLRTGGVGLVGALNEGLRACRAPLIARMDADDESLPGRLVESRAALEADASLAAVGTAVEIFREDRPVSPNMAAYARWLSSLDTPERLFADRLVESPLCHPASMIRRSALEAAGGWEDGEFPEDWQLWLKLLSRGHRLVNLGKLLFRWRDHDRRLTRTDPRYGLDCHQKLRAHFLTEHTLAQGVPVIVWGAGQTGLSLGRLLRARGIQIERFVEVSPRKVGQRIEGVPVSSPQELGSPGDLHLMVAVGAKGAREEIRRFLSERGWQEGRHFTCAA